MSDLIDQNEGVQYLLMGNDAIARGALEAGVSVASGYPGTPSSEIIENLSKVARERNLYVEWSANEKVALEVAAAASFAGLKSLCAMKQNGVNVASDFLLHLAGSGTRGGMVLVACDDPGGLSSVNEGESRHFARLVEIPILEPGDFQEAKEMTKWAFELSEEIKNIVLVRSVTRMSHASGNVRFGKLPNTHRHVEFQFHGPVLDPDVGQVTSAPVVYKHSLQQEKIEKAKNIFEDSPFNTYCGPENPELLIITSSACYLYTREAISLLGVEHRVGLLKLGTTWPLPPKLLKKYFSMTDKIMVVEEVLPFLEENVMVLGAEHAKEIGVKSFYGKHDGTIPMAGELNPDLVVSAMSKVLGIDYVAMSQEYENKFELPDLAKAPERERTFCPGCPHRASFWSIHNALQLDNRKGFVCGDIGCYAMARFACGFSTNKTLHAMGSGAGIASGFGKLRQFGMDQPVLAVCGDSTFFHTGMPPLAEAVGYNSNVLLIIFENSWTAMTGHQNDVLRYLINQGFSIEKISKIWETSEEEAESILNTLVSKGLIYEDDYTGSVLYSLAIPVFGFFEFSLMRTDGMFDHDLLSNLYSKYINDDDNFVKKYFGGKTIISRVYVQEETLPEDMTSEILSYELACILSDRAD